MDLIDRQAAMAMAHFPTVEDAGHEIIRLDDIISLPSAQPTLYGYKIELLAYIARVMEKEGITAEDAARTFGDLGRAVSWTIDEVRQVMEEAVMK